MSEGLRSRILVRPRWVVDWSKVNGQVDGWEKDGGGSEAVEG